ncbi:response regulator transcription factor [Cupriavidus pampae]|uniref:Response regulator protein TodT n=1 Tax=Cupriavidus pampae TaxID=659251 RepID=A0ABN7YKY8_9BURK|nr:response regulator [Cupriavidus pampae]CAG9172507.1 Response regulator protein TodT [Cupriavidus pampae]
MPNPSTLVPLISVVEDDPGVRTALGGLIRSLRLPVALYATPRAFLQSAKLAATTCLIADIELPLMSGFALYASLLAAGYRMPVIFMTAAADDACREQAALLHAAALLEKPFLPSAMVGAIEHALAISPS